MTELPKDSEKEIWLHHNSAGDPCYEFVDRYGDGAAWFVNTVDEDEIKANKGKIFLDTYKGAMLQCEFEGEYVLNTVTGDEIEPCKDGDKHQRDAYKITEATEKEMRENS
tara:strand:+ start:228 stop:557 length:330 start_codon:yes stop_codon:yes gene_type:complete